MRSAIAIVAGVLALVISGCAQPPQPSQRQSESSSQSVTVKICLVTNDQGVDDQGANQFSVAALEQLPAQFGDTLQIAQIESASSSDYAANLQQMVDQSCDLTMGVGSEMSDAVLAAAKANPQADFALIDASAAEQLDNLKPIVFNTHEVGFIGGYLAAASSSTGVVGAFAGLFVPAATMYLDGYEQGVDYYNQTNNTQISLLGWDRTSQTGEQVDSADPLNDPEAAKVVAERLISQGADVILPLAGASNEGALEAASETSTKLIWPDVDACQINSDLCSLVLGSATKDYSAAITQVAQSVVQNQFITGPFVGSVKNGGAAFVTNIDDVGLNTKIDELKTAISQGTINVESSQAIG